MCKGRRRPVAEGTVGPIVIVVHAPRFDAAYGVVERHDLMHVQAFVAQAPVEGFDVGIVGGRAWPREIELDPAVECPRLDRLRGEFGAVVAPETVSWVSGPWQTRLALGGSETSPSEPGYRAGAVVAAASAVDETLWKVREQR